MAESILGKVRNEAYNDAYRNYCSNYAEVSQAEQDEAYEKGRYAGSVDHPSRKFWFTLGIVAAVIIKLLYDKFTQ